ncbi:LOG family protein [Lacticaseibacillus mingshuiensis]|uniref:Cytokinin riboside 5'-monophosphate phosphoribohydrolase n=1 Tax=Lacticaseibacillus mingshuiensis TaxID=2799574 RepID=A0ABW4CD11_9LACO|nr:TIGR00730 family Rossman fold protein [Lacticaseibacillus mingshuiensis]
MTETKWVTVFCGAAAGVDPQFAEATEALGNWLVDHDFGLLYGGGRYGLMGVVAETVLARGGQVYGIVPQELANRGVVMPGLSKLAVVADMSVRKARMIQESTALIALPGGPGTLEEISQAFSWARIGDNPHPCAFYNVAHYYDDLARFFDGMTTSGFLTATDREKLLFSEDLDALGDFIASYQAPAIRTYGTAK